MVYMFICIQITYWLIGRMRQKLTWITYINGMDVQVGRRINTSMSLWCICKNCIRQRSKKMLWVVSDSADQKNIALPRKTFYSSICLFFANIFQHSLMNKSFPSIVTGMAIMLHDKHLEKATYLKITSHSVP
jgi:hypothetical protein